MGQRQPRRLIQVTEIKACASSSLASHRGRDRRKDTGEACWFTVKYSDRRYLIEFPRTLPPERLDHEIRQALRVPSPGSLVVLTTVRGAPVLMQSTTDSHVGADHGICCGDDLVLFAAPSSMPRESPCILFFSVGSVAMATAAYVSVACIRGD